MAKIYNSDCTKGLAKNAGIQQNVDKVPTELAEKIVPTFETNPVLLRFCKIVASSFAFNTTSATIYTTPADRDFYIVAANLSALQDAGATSVASSLKVYIDGVQQTLMSVTNIAGIANSGNILNNYSVPVKIDRNTAIVVTNTTNVANVKANAGIVGYIDESGA